MFSFESSYNRLMLGILEDVVGAKISSSFKKHYLVHTEVTAHLFLKRVIWKFKFLNKKRIYRRWISRKSMSRGVWVSGGTDEASWSGFPSFSLRKTSKTTEAYELGGTGHWRRAAVLPSRSNADSTLPCQRTPSIWIYSTTNTGWPSERRKCLIQRIEFKSCFIYIFLKKKSFFLSSNHLLKYYSWFMIIKNTRLLKL